MKGPSPGTDSSEPEAAAAGLEGVGIVTAARDSSARKRRANRFPVPPAANAATTPAAPVNSRRRRSITHVPVASPSLPLVADRGSTGTTAPRSRRSAITPATVAALAGSASDG